jgi:hypothetical protein
MAIMADQNPMMSIPPGVDPSDWFNVQRRMQLAGALQQQAMTPVQNELQQPSGGGRYYQAARVGPLSAASKLVEALMARRGFQQTMPQMGSIYGRAAQAFAPGGQENPGIPLQSAQNTANPGEQTVQPAIQRLPGASLDQTVQAAQPSTTPVNPLNPQGLPGLAVMRLYEQDPAKYASMLQGTPEWQNAIRAAGGDSSLAMQLMRNEMAKKGMIELRSGGMTYDPATHKYYRAPNLPSGFEPELDAQGNLVGTHPAPGLIPGQAAMTGAEAAARQANELHTLPTQGGGSTVTWGADVGGGPPALRGAPAAGPAGPARRPVPQYFPNGANPSSNPAQAGNSPGRNDPFPDAPRSPTYSGMGAPSEQDKVFQKARADKQVELYSKYGGESDLADQQLVRIAEAQKALAGSNMGPLSEKMTETQAVLHQLFPSMFSGEAATNTMLANKNLVNNALIGAKGIYGPRMTSSEVMLQKSQASPSTEQTREAAAYLLKQQAIVAAYNKKRSDDYQAYVDHGHDPLKFEGWYSVHHSLQNYALQHDPERQALLAKDRGMNVPTAAFDRLTQHPELKEGFKRQFGYLPEGY